MAKIKTVTIKKMDGDIVKHNLTRLVRDIEKEELEEYGKCMFCSIEYWCMSGAIKPTCTKTKIYESPEED